MTLPRALVVVAALVVTAVGGVTGSGASGPGGERCAEVDGVEALFPAAASAGFDTRSAIAREASPADPGQLRPCGRWATTYAGHHGVPMALRVVVDVFANRSDALSEWKVMVLRSVERYPDGALLAGTQQNRVDDAGKVVARESVVISVLGNVFVASDGLWPPDVGPEARDELRVHRLVHAAVHRSYARAAPGNDRLLALERRAGPYLYRYGSRPANAWINPVDAFGLPTRFRERGKFCRVTWAHAGITVEFSSSRGGPCLDEHLTRADWHGMSLYGPGWHNVHGVRVGDPVARVRKLYPKARFERSRRPRRLVLLWARSEPRVVRLAVAVNHAGRVASIEVPPIWVA